MRLSVSTIVGNGKTYYAPIYPLEIWPKITESKTVKRNNTRGISRYAFNAQNLHWFN